QVIALDAPPGRLVVDFHVNPSRPPLGKRRGLLVWGYGCPATRHRWPTGSPYGARDGDLLGCQEVGGTDHTVVLSGWWGVGATPLRRRRPFFFQAEDGIRDFHVTGVQTCALPI